VTGKSGPYGCTARNAGLEGCSAPPRWEVSATSPLVDKVFSGEACSRHLARVCRQVLSAAGGNPPIRLRMRGVPG
jgi:hypothetical protein